MAAEEVTLVEARGDRRSITAEYDAEAKLVEFVQRGEEVFSILHPVEPEEWQQIVDRLGRAAPFMERVLNLVKEIEQIAEGAEPVPDLQKELRTAVRTFAGEIEPEQAVAIAHAADIPEPYAAIVVTGPGTYELRPTPWHRWVVKVEKQDAEPAEGFDQPERRLMLQAVPLGAPAPEAIAARITAGISAVVPEGTDRADLAFDVARELENWAGDQT